MRRKREKRESLLPFPFLLLFFFFLFFVGVFANARSLKGGGGGGDGGVMSDLAKSLTNLPTNWKAGGGDDDYYYCQWSGVSCQSGSGSVTSLNLPGKSISGHLPDSFNQLSSLQTLNIQRNQISGPLPSFANMASLQTLNIDNNAFTSIPPDFFSGLTSLQQVSLDDNPFSSWSIPDDHDLSKCDSLRDFSASNASITGTIPRFFGYLSSLQDLRLSYNFLTGGIPDSFGSSSTIKNLWLNNQQSPEKLTGWIDVIGEMDQLSLLWLQSNSFTGPIPDLSNLSSLASFNARDNQLTGVVPPSLLNSASLHNISLSNNDLQGPFPVFGSSSNNNADVDKGNHFCTSSTNPGPCDPRVTLLLSVAAAFNYPLSLANNWQGNDPCASAAAGGGPSWTGIVCDTQGNIVVLNLANQKLDGTISPDIANLTSLTKVLLNNNALTGPIPTELTSLKSLRLLDVSNNDIWGVVPTFDKSVTVKTSGNARIGTTPPPGSPGTARGGRASSPSGGGGGGGQLDGGKKSKSSSGGGFIVGIVVAVLVLAACLAALVFYLLLRRRRNHKKAFGPVVHTHSPQSEQSDILKIGILHVPSNAARNELITQGSSENPMSTIPIDDLRKATNGFCEDNIVGQGGFGVVYKGNLNGTLVAVKRSQGEMMGKSSGSGEFEAEVHVLQKTRHRHLVTFMGYCRDNNERLLVYEYMTDGTLGQHLFHRDSGKYCVLNWRQRLVIALDVARGIEYLHSLAQESFIHRDLKPSNILLDKDLRAKVSDFGLVKLADKEKSMMTRLAGTFGYLAPEYALTGKVSTKVDVYAFGVILMELITGRKVLDESLPEEDSHLVMAFRRYMINKDKFISILDPSLHVDESVYESIFQVSDLARHCTAREPNQRPTMGYAVHILSPLVDHWVPSTTTNDYDDSCTSLTDELQKWQSDTETSMFSTYKGSSSTNHY